MMGEWKVYSQVVSGVRLYIVGRQLDMSEPLHGGNVEYRGDYSQDEKQVQSLCDELNHIESIDNILEMYGGSATRQDMREKTNVYLVKELLQCNMEDSSLLEIVERFLSGDETLSYVHELLKCHYENQAEEGR